MNPINLLEELARRPLVCDGGMGTELIKRGLTPGACGEAWNLERPDAVEEIHRAYREAGCDLITTNTFGGCESCLERHGLAGQVRQINIAAAQIARRAAGNDGSVLGDMGPFGGFLEPVGDADPRMVMEWYRQQAASLIEGGADAIIVETMSDPQELYAAVFAVRQMGDTPVIATYAFNKADGGTFRTMMGSTVQEAIEAARRAGANVVGANCGTSLSLEDYVRLAGQIVEAAEGYPVIVQPNAGSPQLVDNKAVYKATPQEMAAVVKPLLDAGVRIIGGCCGTNPTHLQAMAAAVRG